MRKVSIDVRMLVARAWGVSYANIARSSCDGSLDLTKGDEPDKGEVNLLNMHVIKQERQIRQLYGKHSSDLISLHYNKNIL